MSQSTRLRLRDQINLFRNTPDQIPFAELLDPQVVEEALNAVGVSSKDRIFTPLVVLWTFLSQVLSIDHSHSCRKAVTRLIAYLTVRGRRACEGDSGAYCKARQRLPLAVIQWLMHNAAGAIQNRTLKSWKWKGREVVLVDGTTVSMPDTVENQRRIPQQQKQKPGLGFPIARLLAVISLSTGVLRDLAIGPYKGKATGETALLRTLLNSLNEGEIALGDRTFASFFGVAQLLARRVDGLFRMHQTREFDFRRGRRLGVQDHIVRWFKPPRPDWMTEELYDRIPNELLIREIRVNESATAWLSSQ